MDQKYVSNKRDGIGNCLFCRGVILKDFRFNDKTGKTSFTLRCPHCQQNILIRIDGGRVLIQEPTNHKE